MKNVVLIGFKSCGKTTLGRKLAKKLNYTFLDIDRVIETLYLEQASIHEKRLTNRDIYMRNGEAFFRDLESKAVEIVEKRQNTVIATGGGTVLNEENAKKLKQSGFVIFLDCDLNTLGENIFSKSQLPAIIDPSCPLESFRKMHSSRMPIYSQIADISIQFSKYDRSHLLDKVYKAIQKEFNYGQQ